MPTTTTFPLPKDPADDSWYRISFWEPLASITSATATAESTDAPPLTVGLPTPGDSIATPELTVASFQLSEDTYGAMVLLSGGVAGTAYAVRVSVVTLSGSTLNRSVILQVAGL